MMLEHRLTLQSSPVPALLWENAASFARGCGGGGTKFDSSGDG